MPFKNPEGPASPKLLFLTETDPVRFLIHKASDNSRFFSKVKPHPEARLVDLVLCEDDKIRLHEPGTPLLEGQKQPEGWAARQVWVLDNPSLIQLIQEYGQIHVELRDPAMVMLPDVYAISLGASH